MCSHVHRQHWGHVYRCSCSCVNGAHLLYAPWLASCCTETPTSAIAKPSTAPATTAACAQHTLTHCSCTQLACRSCRSRCSRIVCSGQQGQRAARSCMRMTRQKDSRATAHRERRRDIECKQRAGDERQQDGGRLHVHAHREAWVQLHNGALGRMQSTKRSQACQHHDNQSSTMSAHIALEMATTAATCTAPTTTLL